jgi:hypothetical protein
MHLKTIRLLGKVPALKLQTDIEADPDPGLAIEIGLGITSS